MRMHFWVALIASVITLPCTAAPSGRLELPAFSDLQKSAKESVDITLGSLPLALAASFAGENADPEARDLLKKVNAVYVRSYQFDSDFAYPMARVEEVRAQLAREGWNHLVQVKQKDQRNVDISVALEGDQVRGFAIVATEPRQFTIVNIVGTFDVKELGKVQDQLGLPKIAAAELADIP
jgi:uncharacterized protein DUF4252